MGSNDILKALWRVLYVNHKYMFTKLGGIPGPYDQNPTRWDELRQTVSIVVDIASV